MIEATSCGGVVIFRGKILLLYKNVRNKYEGWVLPKGTVEAGEEYPQTALREVLEESGAKAEIIKYIGKSEYSFTVPEDVVEKLVEANKLEVFDNYVIMHYDPKKKAVKPTEKEIAKETIKKRDPILFGVISGSRKLYYIADWIDEYCDLTLEKFVETLDIDKKDLLLKGPKDEVKKAEEPAPSEDKPKKKTSTKKKTSKKKEE